MEIDTLFRVGMRSWVQAKLSQEVYGRLMVTTATLRAIVGAPLAPILGNRPCAESNKRRILGETKDQNHSSLTPQLKLQTLTHS
jgi:hypothetical protein